MHTLFAAAERWLSFTANGAVAEGATATVTLAAASFCLFLICEALLHWTALAFASWFGMNPNRQNFRRRPVMNVTILSFK